MKTIGLIFGSTDSEHDISIKSAGSVFSRFPKDKYHLLPIYITKQGEWVSGNYDQNNFDTLTFPKEKSLIFNFNATSVGLYEAGNETPLNIDGALLILHGPVGEGGMIQGLLKMANIPFTGSELTSSALCMDKAFTHQICEHEGIKMARYQLVSSFEDIDHSKLTYPCVIKPSREGSSFGITYAEDEDTLKAGILEAQKYDNRILVEDYINGQELSVAIFKTKKHNIVSWPTQATRFKPVADFEEKYISEVQETLYNPPYSDEVLKRTQKEAAYVFDILDCKHMARVDFFITEDETLYFNEINTIPGFTSVSLYPSIIEKSGMSYEALIEALIEDIL